MGATSSGYHDDPYAIEDGSGGIFVGWQSVGPGGYAIRLQRLTASGAPAPGWPDTGLTVCQLPTVLGGVGLATDMAGGAFVTWADLRSASGSDGNQDAYAQRVSANGQIVWTAFPQGRPVDTRPEVEGGWPVSDGVGGVFIGLVQADAIGGFESDFYVTRLTANGDFVPGFESGPKPITVFPGIATNGDLITDGNGGMYLSWQEPRNGSLNYYMQRLAPSGDPATGWPVGGLAVGAEPGHLEYRGRIVTDMQGGVYCAFNSEGSDGFRVLVQHVRGDATLAPGWPALGVDVSPGFDANTGADDTPVMDSDGRGGVIVAWTHQKLDYNRNGVYAQRYGPASIVATSLSLLTSSAEPGRVRLQWQVGGDALTSAEVQRRSSSSADWKPLSSLAPDGERRLTYDDRDVVAGSRYAYRLEYRFAGESRFSAESWIEVPLEHTFAMHGASRNPSPRGALAVELSLRGTARAALELYDVTGRRVVVRDLSGTSPGRRTLALPEAATLETGLYWVLLREGTNEARARVVLLQ